MVVNGHRVEKSSVLTVVLSENVEVAFILLIVPLKNVNFSKESNNNARTIKRNNLNSSLRSAFGRRGFSYFRSLCFCSRFRLYSWTILIITSKSLRRH